MQDINKSTFAETIANSNKVTVVDFWAPWCGPCKMMLPVLTQINEEMTDSVSIVKVNADEEYELCQEYGIRAVPTLVYFKDGKKVAQQGGARTKADVVKQIKELTE